MTRTYRKNIIRSFKSAGSRFAAIFSIVALGVGFLAGLNATPIDMRESMEHYLDGGNFYDLRIVSTMGLTDDDVAALQAVDGVEAVQPSYSADLLIDAEEDVLVSRVLSVPPEGEDAINKLTLVEGRMPQNSGECVLEASSSLEASTFPIGTTLHVSTDNEELDTKLERTDYTVVGIVHNTNYFSFEREPASVGNGTVDLVLYLLPQDFAYETYTEIYVTASGALAMNSMEDEYDATVEAVQDRVEAIQDERCQARYDDIRAEAQAEIDDAWQEYYDAKAEADEELADAAQELEDGRKELADGEQEYRDGEQEYADGVQELADNEAKVNDGEAQLADGMRELLENQAKLEDGEAELAANAPKLEDARKELESGQAEYESGLKQYEDGLAQIEDGERQLAEGKKKLDESEEKYQAGLELMAYQITEALKQMRPDPPGQPLNVTADNIQDYIDWFDEKGYNAPKSYDELLDRTDEYLLETMGWPAGMLPLTSTARTVQEKAAEMLKALQDMLSAQPGGEGGTEPGDGNEGGVVGNSLEPDETETLAGEENTEPAEESESNDIAAEDAVDGAVPPGEGSAAGNSADMKDGQSQNSAPEGEQASKEPAEPEKEETEPGTQPVQEEKEGEPAVESVPQESASDGEADAAEQPAVVSAAMAVAHNKAPETRIGGQDIPLTEEEQQLVAGLIEQLMLIKQADRADMKTTLETAQGWIEKQTPPQRVPPLATLYDNFVQLVQGGLEGLEQEKTQTEALVTGFAETLDGRRELDAGWEEYNANAQKLADGRKEMEAAAVQLADAKRQLDDGWKQYNDGVAEYEAGKKEIADGWVQLNDGWATLTDKQIELADARRQINDAKAELADARAELDDARQTIAENKQKLLDGEIEYADAVAEVEEELADARAEIEDGQKELDDIEFPEWHVWNRSNNVSFSSFTGNVDKLTAITTIFPVFFFLVAALVVSTTMTRMVEEERLQIGTLKALGYTRGEIMRKYLWYAFAAALTGTAVGLAVGFKAFPTIIWSAYAMMYYMPAIYTPWRAFQAVFAGGTLTVLSVGITALACRASLGEVPAALMLPRAPKAGKRILLERITPLWRRFPFTWKVTCRNLLRYKKRFWMTVIGVAGCTSLLVAGFGISDSLNAIIEKQYTDISHYDLMTVVTKEQAVFSGPVYDCLYDNPQVGESIAVAMQATRQDGPDGEMDVYLMVPEDVQRFAEFADLHERISRDPTPLGEEGVVITEKLATILGVQAGDTVTLEDSDENVGTFTVTGVCEHYVSNYVYMSAATYAQGFGEEVSYNAILSKLPDDSEAVRDDLSARLLDMDNVASVNFTEDNVVQVLNMLNSIDAVVVLIIVCAASLAFVVLYNLSNINIAERVKEIATIKVLGFYDREVDAYVNRESVALTLIGTLFGAFGGIALHRFIIVTVEVDAVMFGRDIQPLSFVYAIALTLLFSLLVNLVMGRMLKKISMVESMKAPE
ncbi:MAG TPA: ABC transporter permease [Candidatus Gemmiger excrementavium]|uniref:ABC transporter permease n=1 Tax=Candidatus Gemmiger excrementavium TaxID=2838608 RepID=A0A9D2F1W4_9FIRM|nr:ABC transporter permease [Candidatus Gemmiger excrementavium]